MLIDLIIVVMFALGLYRGFHTGLVKTVLSVVAWLVALVLASLFASTLSPLFIDFSEVLLIQKVMAFASIVLAVVVMGHLLIWFSQRTLKLFRLSLLDKLLGAIFGGVRASIKILIMLTIISPVLIHTQMWQHAQIAQQILPLTPIAKALVVQAWQEIESVDVF